MIVLSSGPSRRRAARGVGTVLLAAGAAAIAGYVFDGAGQPALGFWAMAWGIGGALLGLTAVAVSSRWRAGGVLAALLAAGAAITGGGLAGVAARRVLIGSMRPR